MQEGSVSPEAQPPPQATRVPLLLSTWPHTCPVCAAVPPCSCCSLPVLVPVCSGVSFGTGGMEQRQPASDAVGTVWDGGWQERRQCCAGRGGRRGRLQGPRPQPALLRPSGAAYAPQGPNGPQGRPRGRALSPVPEASRTTLLPPRERPGRDTVESDEKPRSTSTVSTPSPGACLVSPPLSPSPKPPAPYLGLAPPRVPAPLWHPPHSLRLQEHKGTRVGVSALVLSLKLQVDADGSQRSPPA